jgi:hypothetical protein
VPSCYLGDTNRHVCGSKKCECKTLLIFAEHIECRCLRRLMASSRARDAPCSSRCARDAGRRIFFDSLARIIKWDDGTPVLASVRACPRRNVSAICNSRVYRCTASQAAREGSWWPELK